jgi:hypothetical protein
LIDGDCPGTQASSNVMLVCGQRDSPAWPASSVRPIQNRVALQRHQRLTRGDGGRAALDEIASRWLTGPKGQRESETAPRDCR